MNHRMATSMFAIDGIPFIEGCIKRIELTKDLFSLEIEQGLEVQVPRSLSQSHLPHSFRYYDGILSMVRERVSQKTCQAFIDRSYLSYHIHKSNDKLLNFRQNFILGHDRKLTF